MDDQPSVSAQIVNGVYRTGKFLLVFFTAGFLIIGIVSLLHPEQEIRVVSASSHPLAVGAVFLLAGLAVLLPTLTRWVTILPGILAYAVIGGLIEIATGHAINSSMPVPRWASVALTIYMIAATFMTSSFQNRRLRPLDYLALLIFVLCVLASMVETIPTRLFSVLAVGFVFLMIAWALERRRLAG
jgi:hypothetical protein